ncbi:RluA family pseudouridine synthase [Sphingomonas sp. LY160]|uniref:RluA family pseudouridine synthase n=1 Tax=Sphingomonas sp. LY160 TaxID=3095342 RepID=UPI002ADEE06F|nr:RluA family pseudouridine synthase [Sphingomonas sp. LY160]MEA1072795.1 RluA family pseudouridine synthase [Sphingomonas sp. LY160]
MTAPPSDTVRTFTVGEDDDGIRLDRWFKRHLADTSFNTVSRWARTGQLRVDGKRATPGDRLTTGMVLRVPPAEPAPAEGPGARPQRIIEPLTADEAAYVQEMVMAKGRDWFVLNKPPGLATQGGTKTVQHLDRLLDGLADDEGNRPKLVHRLDKDTSGVLLVARSARAAGHFAKSFSGRTARKVYWALITGVPSADEGVIDAPLAKQPGTGGEKMHVDEENGLPARTRYRLIDRAGNRAAWVELQPMTGRTHQLRAHMAAIGHPIVGDAKYGGAEAFLTGGISRKMHLHARRLRIDGLDGKPIDQTAELPSHFAESLATLGFEAMAGDMMPLDNPDPAKLPETKAKRVAAAAKTARKARKGERRGRGGPPAGKPTKSGRPARPSKPTKPRRP